MSVLSKIRNKAGLLIGIIGLALLSFIIGDIFTTGRSFFGSKENIIGEVAGKELSVQEFDFKVQQILEQQKRRNPDMQLDDYVKDMMVQQTWNQTVNDIIMQKEYEGLGINVSDEELYELMMGQNPHPMMMRYFTDPKTGKVFEPYADPRTGGINTAKIAEYTQQMNPEQEADWAKLEEAIRTTRIEEKYNNLVKKSFYVTSAQAKREYTEANKNYTLRYIVKRYNTIPDSSIKVEESDLKDYYYKHQNDYKVEEDNRKIEYVSFDALPTEEDSVAIKEDLNTLLADFKANAKFKDDSAFVVRESDSRSFDDTWHKKGSLSLEIDSLIFASESGTVIGPYTEGSSYKLSKLLSVKMLPDSVKARHILIKINNNDTAKAKAKADSIKKLITPKTFATIAQAVSEDAGSAIKGGDLGWFPYEQMVKPFSEACFNGKKGEMPIVISEFGVHLIEVLDKGPEVKRVKVGTIDRKIQPSTKTLQSIYLKASEFSGKNNTSEQFLAAAEKMNKRIADNVKQNDKNIPGIESSRELVRWIYSAEKGQVSQAFELGNKFVVAHLSEIKEKGLLPLDQVKEELTAGAVQEKKAIKLAEEFSKKAQGATSIDALASKTTEMVQTIDNYNFTRPALSGIGRDGDFIGAVYPLKKGVLSKPIKGKSGVYVVVVDQVSEPTPITELASQKNRIASTLQSKVEGELAEALKEAANVVDNRGKFY